MSIEQPSSNQMLDPSLLMDNAACASQCAELLDDHPTRQAVLMNVYRPLWDEIERLRAENQALRNLAENLRPGPISEALGGVEHERPYRAAVETSATCVTHRRCEVCDDTGYVVRSKYRAVIGEPCYPQCRAVKATAAPETTEQHRLLISLELYELLEIHGGFDMAKYVTKEPTAENGKGAL